MFIAEPPDDPWDVNLVFDPPSPVRVVSAASGLVVAAGRSLHMLRPGSQRIRSRDLPPDDEVTAVAAEPWSPYRFAIASPSSVSVFTGHRPYEPIMSLGVQGPEVRATHLAWMRHDGETMLYMRRASGEIMRLRLEQGSTEVIQCPTAAAVAADEGGVLALAALVPAEDANVGEVWVLPAGETTWDPRWVDFTLTEDLRDWHVYLAVHGGAVAFSTGNLGDDTVGSSEVSWEKPEEGDSNFESPPSVFQGPIALQDDRVIFAAYNVEGQVRILRHVRKGGVTRIARFGVGDDWVSGTDATVTGLAWDSERRALWAASPELGLIKLTEPAKAAIPPS